MDFTQLKEKYYLTENEKYVLNLFGFGNFIETECLFPSYGSSKISLKYKSAIPSEYENWLSNYEFVIFIEGYSYRQLRFGITSKLKGDGLNAYRHPWNAINNIGLKELCLYKDQISLHIKRFHAFVVGENANPFVNVDYMRLKSLLSKNNFGIYSAIKKYEKPHWMGVDKDAFVELFEEKVFFIICDGNIYSDKYIQSLLGEKEIKIIETYYSHKACADLIQLGCDYVLIEADKGIKEEFSNSYNEADHHKYLLNNLPKVTFL